jgi:hypothetical protein
MSLTSRVFGGVLILESEGGMDNEIGLDNKESSEEATKIVGSFYLS